MYITCQDCKTTFRLDENLLKPTGSKVRCSQCGNIFVAVPPPKDEAATIAQATPPPMADAPMADGTDQSQQSEAIADAVADVESDMGTPISEGIDVSEFDSLLKNEQPEPEAPTAETDMESENIDDIDFDIDFDAALETDIADEVATPEPSIEDQPADDWGDLDLDLDFDLDGEEEPTAVSEKEPPLPEDTDDESATMILGSETADESQSEGELEDLELSLDLDDFSDETVFADISDIEQSSGDDEDELSLDFDEDATVFAPTDEMSQGDDLSELDLDLEGDLNIEGILEDADQSQPDSQGESAIEDIELSLDDSMDLDLELDDEPAASPETDADAPKLSDTFSGMEGDDLVLSDLDAILDESALESDDAELKEDIELELDLDGDLPEGEEEELEELSFELDAEFEDKPIAQTDTSEVTAESVELEDDDEIDLSDIEQMLEGDGEISAPAGSLDSDVESEATLLADDDLGIDNDEIDLTELEAAIDSVGDNIAEETATFAVEDMELSLAPDMDADEELDASDSETELDIDLDELDIDLEMDSSESAAAPQMETSQEDDLDLSDLDNLMMESEGADAPTDASIETTVKPEIIDSGDIELEFQIEDEEPNAQVQEHLDTLTPETTPLIDEAVATPPPVEEQKVEKKPKKSRPVKKKSNKLLLVIFILVLLGAIGYGVYYAVTVLNIEIPYVSQYLKPAPKDPAGIIKLSTLEISSKFIENEQSGRLFVITGKVHNAYQEPRTKIRLQGKLFTKGKVLSQSEYVYAGVILSDQELTTLEKADIKQRLSTAPDNVKVMPNQNLQFMVIFSDLPSTEELDEFALEPVRSVAAQ